MEQVTLRIPEDMKNALDEEYEEQGFESRSEYVRDILEKRHRADELEQEINQLEARLDEQERREQERNQLEERVDELAIEVREQKNRAPWPLGWVGDIRDYVGEDDDERD